ncbi:MAG: long-chain fatty acid--CoA ligase [Acidobacteriota bacterium]|nr:long-chain fatty acid--CoA ligase [Acidobacteriota bacterium]
MKAAPYRSIPDLFLSRVTATPDAPAFLYPEEGIWKSLSWRETAARVRELACGLLSLGLSAGDRVAIVSSTRLEWILADLAIACAGGVTATVYPVSTEEDTSFILTDSRAAIVFAEDADQARRIVSRRDALPRLRHLVLFNASAGLPGDAMSLLDLAALGRAWDAAHPGGFDAAAGAIGPSDLATLIYTSGTTGRPKGVELPHDCWLFEIESIGKLNLLGPSDLQFLWLPLSHVFGKVCVTLGIGFGFPTAVDGRVDRIAANLASVRPTFVCVVPRIFEKVHAKILEQALASGKAKAAIFRWALGVGTEVARRRSDGRGIGVFLEARRRVADALVFEKVRRRFGGRLRFFICGSVALARELTEFFAAFGVTILEGYGLSESTAMTVSNLPHRNRWGTVGLPIPGIEVSFAADGEILLRGRGIMRGYFGLPEETARVIDPEGWLHTGDIGALDAAGHLTITDRKKDLIKTSGGKFVAPQHVEGKLKLDMPLIAQALLHGEGRRFCSALISLSEEELLAWARAEGIQGASYAELVRDPRVVEIIRRHVEHVNAHLARYEAIRRWAILPAELKIETGELTPSLKVRRRVVEQRYREVLESLYAEVPAGVPADSAEALTDSRSP